MAGRRQPTALLEANGRKHLTEAEADARRDQEVYVAPPEAAVPPRWLPKKLHKEFREIGEILLASGLYSELDRDVLGQYFLARERWLRADKLASQAIRDKDETLAQKWASTQNTYFRQARQCAESMGLSVTARCRSWCPRPSRTPGRPARTMERMSSPRRCGPGRQRRWRGPYDRHGPGPVHPA